MTSNEALSVEIAGLRELTTTKLDYLRDAVEKLTVTMVTEAAFTAVERRVTQVEEASEKQDATTEDVEDRLERCERVVWLQVGIFTLFGVPTILMVLGELVGRLL